VLTRRAILQAALAAAGLGVVPLLAACGAEPGTADKAGSVPGGSVALSRATRRAADRAARQPGARVVQSFGTDLFRALATTDGNRACSPYSVAVALGMTRNGARGRTATEMDHVLHATSAAELDAGLNALTQHIESLAHERKRDDGSVAKVTVDAANSLWGQRGVTWEPPFLDALAESFGTGMRQVDYLRDYEAARKAINAWTSDQTHAKIPALIPRGILDDTTRLVLVNAIYLKAPWAVPFEKSATRDRPFTRADGSTVDVPMMSYDSSSPLAYARGSGWQAIDLVYDGAGLAMAVVVPDAGHLDEITAGFDADFLGGVLAGLQSTGVALQLPRWTFRTQVLLNDLLKMLGMPTAFTDNADFSGMTRDMLLAIQAVVHEAFIAVDEQGTEAAAATAVAMRETSAMVDTIDLTVDRPFLFVLHDTATGTPLFIGRVSDPTADQ
jgi:serine protease inhibitor